jgi:hypothetical protein
MSSATAAFIASTVDTTRYASAADAVADCGRIGMLVELEQETA